MLTYTREQILDLINRTETYLKIAAANHDGFWAKQLLEDRRFYRHILETGNYKGGLTNNTHATRRVHITI